MGSTAPRSGITQSTPPTSLASSTNPMLLSEQSAPRAGPKRGGPPGSTNMSGTTGKVMTEQMSIRPLLQRRGPRAVRATRSHYETPGACGGR